jgi:hypothetical protein
VIVAGPSLVVSARVCAALERAVADAEARARRAGLELDREVAQAVADLHELAAWARARASAATAPMDGAAVAGASSPAMTTAQAAARLEVTPSRVRQRLRAGTLAGVRRNGRWRVVLEEETAHV